MIELIFAIVVISIAVVTLPVMTGSTDKALEGNIIQEGIFAAGTAINEASTLYWDQRSQDDTNSSGGLSRVLNLSDLNCNRINPLQTQGQINRRCLDENVTAAANDTTDASTIDNMEVTWNNTNIITDNPEKETYKQGYFADADVSQCATTGCTTPSGSVIKFGETGDGVGPSLKQIDFEIADSDGNTLIVLRAFSANIGDVEIEKGYFHEKTTLCIYNARTYICYSCDGYTGNIWSRVFSKSL